MDVGQADRLRLTAIQPEASSEGRQADSSTRHARTSACTDLNSEILESADGSVYPLTDRRP